MSGTPARQRGVTHTRTVNLGTGRNDPGPAGGRTASEREQEEMDDQGNVPMGGSSNRNVRNRNNSSVPTTKKD